jgi:simple sugar transport system substrate-binding protein
MLQPAEEPPEEPEITRADVEEFLNAASTSELRSIVEATVPEDMIADLAPVPTEPRPVTLAIEHFSIIEGTTWSGAHHRAGQRLEDRYDWLTYVYDEEVGPDETNPVAIDFIENQSADIVVGNAEFMGLPLRDIADDYPEVYFVSIVASDLSTRRNFLRFFPRQYQSLYLEGLIAGALTETNNIGICSAFPAVQVARRQNAFYLGVKDANPDAEVYVKHVGDWYVPATETEVSRTLVDEYDCDVLTNQTDSSAPVTVASEEGVWFVGKDMDIQELGWGDDSTIAVSFDTRWEVGYEQILKEYMAKPDEPKRLYFVGMDQPMVLGEDEIRPVVDLQNGGRTGLDAISPQVLPSIPQDIIDMIESRRNLLLSGRWDPFLYEFVSNGTGVDLSGAGGPSIPPAGEVVKPEGEMPTDAWLLSRFNFDLEGMTILAPA